jgi:hypothetical protein
LSLTSAASEPNLRELTALKFAAYGGGQVRFYAATAGREAAELVALTYAALTGGRVQFYAATAGREAAELVARSLGVGLQAFGDPKHPVASLAVIVRFTSTDPFASLAPVPDSSLPLVATVLTLEIPVSGEEQNLGLAETEVASVATFLPGAGVSLGQGPPGQSRGGRVTAFLPGAGVSLGQGPAAQARGGGGADADAPAQSDEAGANGATTAPAAISAWERVVIGLDEGLDRFRRENPGGLSGAGAVSSAGDRPEAPSSPAAPAQDGPSSMRLAPDSLPSAGAGDGPVAPSLKVKAEEIDAAVESHWGATLQSERAVRAQSDAVIRLNSARAALSPTLPEPGQDGPGLVLASLLVALLAARWGDHRQSSSSRLNSRFE